MMIRKGVVVDFMDHYIKISKSVVMESLRRFVRAIVEVFGGEYLRSLINEKRISRDAWECRLYEFGVEIYPSTWHSEYTGHAHEPTIILEAVVSRDLWIWHVSLDYQDLLMISMFFTAHIFLQT
jgi:hypothetical protein